MEVSPVEQERLTALHSYYILDTPPEASFDRFAELAARVFQAPMAFVSFVDATRLWVKSAVGFEVREIARELSVCSRVVETGEAIVVEDAYADPAYATHPFVTDGPRVRAYAGVPLRSRDGYAVGTLCIAGHAPRRFSPEDLDLLRMLAAQVEAELELRRERDQYRSFFAANPNPMWIFEQESLRFLEVNAAAVQKYGYAREEFLGMTIADIRPPGDVPALARDLERGKGTAKYVGQQWHHLKKDGSLITVEITSQPLVYEGIPARLVLALDITQRLHTEDALKASREQYRAVVDTVQEVIFEADATGRWTFLSPAWARIMGVTVEASLGRGFLEFVHSDDRDENLKKFEPLVAGAKSECWHESRYVTARGEIKWILVHATPFYDAEGRMVGTRGTLTDVTERRVAEEALREREVIYRATLAAVPDLVLRLSSTGTYLDFQTPDPSKLAVPPVKIIGKKLHEVLPEEVASACMGGIRRALATGEVQTVEYTIQVASGAYLDFEARIAVSSRDEVIAIVRDITDRKVHEAGLIHAKERAEEMSRLKSSFLANMSHEIRTPLTSIIGFSEVLAEDFSGEGQELVRMIHTSGQRLLETLNSVLDLAQLESGSLAITREQVDLAEAARAAAEMFRHVAEKNQLYLKVEPGREPVLAEADRAALGRVLSNLISNALKFTDEGGVVVEIGCGEGTGYVRVVDTGLGISEAFLPNLFEEFRQESTGVTRSHEGSGLGLTITKRLVELMGGRITVESRRYEGSVFTVELPLASGGPARQAEEDPAAAPPRNAGSRILVVEDQEQTQLLLAFVLSKRYAVDLAISSREALEKASSIRYDAVLLDINLGGQQSGREVLTQLRRLPGYGSVPVLACTAYALPGDRERFLDAGFDGYVGKPFKKQDLLNTLRNMMDGAHAKPRVRAVPGRS